MPTVREEFIKFKPNSVSLFNAFVKYLKREPEWEDFTDERLYDYKWWLMYRYSYNSVCHYCSAMRLFLNCHKSQIPAKKYVMYLLLKEESKIVKHNNFILDDIEIQQLLDYKPTYDNEAFVLTLFLVMMKTGASIIDAEIFTKENVMESQKRLFYTTEETGKDISISIDDYTISLIYELERLKKAKTIKQNHYNRTLHSICKNAGMKRVMSFGKPIWQIVNMTTARKTFATRMSYRYTAESVQEMMGLRKKERITSYIVGYVHRNKPRKR